MPYGTFFQSSTATAPATAPSLTTTNTNPASAPDASAATQLAEAIDSFLGDLESKFQGISDEILTKLDDMAERCDRLEAELLMKEAVSAEGTASTAGAGTGAAKSEEGAS